MEGILLDTNVISELIKPRPDTNVAAFLRKLVHPWLCSITLHELVYGAERSPDPLRRTKLLAWTAQIASDFADRTIPVDSEIAERSGRLRALASAQGRPASVIDAVIAAAAMSRGLRLATRNTRDFELFGIGLIDPWTDRRPG